MNEISESQEIKLIQKHKQALAEFTCAMQSKKLSNFKQLQQQKIFYDIINEIGEMADFEDINQTLLYLKTLFKQFKVNIKLLDIVSNWNQKDSGKYYTTLIILQSQDQFFLMYEVKDYMDEEAIHLLKQDIKEKEENEG